MQALQDKAGGSNDLQRSWRIWNYAINIKLTEFEALKRLFQWVNHKNHVHRSDLLDFRIDVEGTLDDHVGLSMERDGKDEACAKIKG